MTREEGAIEQAWRIIRRRKIIVLQALIGVPLIALALSLTQEKEYTATATLLFRETPTAAGESSVVDPTREAATNGELVALPVVADEAAALINDAIPAGEIFEAVEVTPSSDADTAAISATTTSAQRSSDIANAYANAYISFRRNADREQVQGAIELAEQSLGEMTPEETAGPQGEALRKELDQLKLNQALQTGGAELVQRASPPSEPSSPEPKKNVALGIILGALLGFGLAALLERVDRRVRSSEEMEEIYSLPIVGRIPRSSRLAEAPASQAIGAQTLEGEAFRALRANLRYFSVDQQLKSILIVSPEEGDGKSTVARSLAMAMAEMGDHVVLVEADLRKGSAFRQVTGQPAPGLSNVLTGTALESVLVHIHVQAPSHSDTRALAVLPSGPIPPNPSELLESQRMRDVLVALRSHYEIVILDSPALGAVSDALAVVPEASEIVVVGGLGKTTRDAARELVKQFSLLDKKPIGIIVNFAEAERAKYSHYYRPDLVGNGAQSS